MLYHGWFGKALGAVAALIFAPEQPIALFLAVLAGLALGHLLDRWSRACSEKLTHSLSAARKLKHPGRKLLKPSGLHAHPHMIFAFTGLGRLAKAGGRVRRAHIRYVEDLMRQLKFQTRDREAGIQWFQQGKDPDFDFLPLSKACSEVKTDRDLLGEMTLECLCLCAWASGVPDQTTHDELQRLAELLGTSHTLQREIEARVARLRGTDLATAESLRQAYTILGVSRDARPGEIKLAYRRRLSQVHPDKIPLDQTSPAQNDAGGDTLDPRQLAQMKTRQVRAAYELIRSQGQPDSSAGARPQEV